MGSRSEALHTITFMPLLSLIVEVFQEFEGGGRLMPMGFLSSGIPLVPSFWKPKQWSGKNHMGKMQVNKFRIRVFLEFKIMEFQGYLKCKMWLCLKITKKLEVFKKFFFQSKENPLIQLILLQVLLLKDNGFGTKDIFMFWIDC
jgi:hypothetical protein